MEMTQISTFTLFQFSGFLKRFWAFKQMGLAPEQLKDTPGLQFFKLLGTGRGNGFSIRPDFSRYGMLGVWDDEAAADAFFAHHPVFADYREHATSFQTFYLHHTTGHGAWDGCNPFVATRTFDPEAPVAVITRATIRPSQLLRFWRKVPGVSRDVSGRPGLRLAVGIGELPLVQQATFSLWDSGRQMMEYAYQRENHRRVVRQTRELGWYKEELFARFLPYREFPQNSQRPLTG